MIEVAEAAVMVPSNCSSGSTFGGVPARLRGWPLSSLLTGPTGVSDVATTGPFAIPLPDGPLATAARTSSPNSNPATMI